MFSILAIIATAYLIGSISSSWVIGRVVGGLDLRMSSACTISPATVYRKLGKVPFFLAVIMDVSLGISAVMVARILDGSITVQCLAGLAAIMGHNWSVFLKFKGGQGATTMVGIFVSLIFMQFLFGLCIAGLVFVFTHKTGLSTLVGIIAIACGSLIQYGLNLLAIYPLILYVPMLLKKRQLDHAARVIN